MPDPLMSFRVPEELRAAFDAACRERDVTASQVLRAAMRRFIEEAARERDGETGNGRRN